MTSKLDSIFRTTFRPAESSDSWLGIRREHLQEDGRKKQDRQKEADQGGLWEDDKTTVSVGALKSFLRDMIAASHDDSGEKGAAAPAGKPPDNNPARETPGNQKAINAYQNTAQLTEPKTYDTAAARETSAGLALTADEIRTIHTLIQDLEIIEKKSIETLTIHRSDSFLQGLVDAAQAEISS